METPLIPRDVLFGNPERVSPKLSPDGLRLAYIAPDEGVLNVWVRTVGEADDRVVTRDRDRGIRGYAWAHNGRDLLYLQDRGGDENWHIYQVSADGDGSKARDLTPIDGVQARIQAMDRDYPDEILVALNDRDPQLHDVYRVDLKSGERELVQENDIGAVDWVADHKLVIRAAQVPTREGGFDFRMRDGPDSDWRDLLSVPPDDALTSHLLGFSRDHKQFYLLSSTGTNSTELRAVALGSGEVRVLASDPTADVDDVVFDPLTKRPQAVLYQRARLEWEVLDPSLEADISRLQKLHPGDLHLMGRDRADRHWLVAHTSDKGPVTYHAYDRDSGQARFLFTSRKALEECPLAAMQPVSLKARDGLILSGYLTIPPGVEPKGLPAVVNVHGGPWARDVWGFHPEAQWLANSGYICLQINYRGSTGYGKGFVNAGDKEWGGKMQDDITDATRWLVEQGYADPERLAIYGGSYGGFAVLSGLTKEPELYRCGVDIVGPSNLVSFTKSIPPYWKPVQALFERRVGNLETEEEFLKERSPLFRIDHIVAPLLIVQGRNDPRVKVEESLQIVGALREAGKTVEYLEFADEGHGFAKPENRLRYYAVAERFLAGHLGGRFEPE